MIIKANACGQTIYSAGVKSMMKEIGKECGSLPSSFLCLDGGGRRAETTDIRNDGLTELRNDGNMNPRRVRRARRTDTRSANPWNKRN